MTLLLILAARFSRAVLFFRRLVLRYRPTLICNPKPSDILYRALIELRLSAKRGLSNGMCVEVERAARHWQPAPRFSLYRQVPAYPRAAYYLLHFKPAGTEEAYWYPRWVKGVPFIKPRKVTLLDAADYAIGQGN